MINRLFSNKDKIDEGSFEIEVVCARLTYSRCRFEWCSIKLDQIDASASTLEKSSHLIGNSSHWKFRECFQVKCGNTNKLTVNMTATFAGFDGVKWEGRNTIHISDLSEEAIYFDIAPISATLAINSDDPIFENISEASAVVSLRVLSSSGSSPIPLAAPIAKIDLTVWQGRSLNTKSPCFVTVGLLPHSNNSSLSEQQRQKSLVLPNSNPIFDHLVELDIYTILKGDVVVEVWESHTLMANRILGQAIIPLSWLVTPGAVDGENMTISGWFEVFPDRPTTRYNSYGQFRPYVRGIPIQTGYGLPKQEKPIGLLKIDATMRLERNLNLFKSFVDRSVRQTAFTEYDADGEPRLSKSTVSSDASMLALQEAWQLDEDEADLGHAIQHMLSRTPVALTLLDATRVDPYFVDAAFALPTDDDTGISSLLVSANNFRRIFTALRDPPFVEVFYDIVEWRSHPIFTVIMLGLHTYTFLFAPGWQYPVLIAVFFALLGAATAGRRNFMKTQLYAQDAKDAVDDGPSLSLTEKFNTAKTTTAYVHRMSELYAKNVERALNLLTWADYTVTLSALIMIFAIACFMSYCMKLFTPHVVMFLGGFGMFFPRSVIANIRGFIAKKIDDWFLSRGYGLRFIPKLAKLGLVDVTLYSKSSCLSSSIGRNNQFRVNVSTQDVSGEHAVSIESVTDAFELREMQSATLLLKYHELSGMVHCSHWDELISSAISNSYCDNLSTNSDGTMCGKYYFYHVESGTNIATPLKRAHHRVDLEDILFAKANTEPVYTQRWCELWWVTPIQNANPPPEVRAPVEEKKEEGVRRRRTSMKIKELLLPEAKPQHVGFSQDFIPNSAPYLKVALRPDELQRYYNSVIGNDVSLNGSKFGICFSTDVVFLISLRDILISNTGSLQCLVADKRRVSVRSVGIHTAHSDQSKAIDYANDPIFRKYYQLRSSLIPVDVLRQNMLNDGVSADLVDAFIANTEGMKSVSSQPSTPIMNPPVPSTSEKTEKKRHHRHTTLSKLYTFDVTLDTCEFSQLIPRKHLQFLSFGMFNPDDQLSWISALTNAAGGKISLELEHKLIADTRLNENKNEGGPQISPGCRPKKPRGALEKMVYRFLWQLLYMAPDNMELQHRHICGLAKVDDTNKFSNKSLSELSWPSSIRVTVVKCRNLPLHVATINRYLANPTVHAVLSLRDADQVLKAYKTAKQPRSPDPVFREDFEFHDIEFNDTGFIQVDIISRNVAKIGKTEQRIGSVQLKVLPLCTHEYLSGKVTEWYTFSDSYSDDAAILLEIQCA